MLASDLNNPEFSNPMNPDTVVHAEFYDHAALDTWATQEKGIKVYKPECPFIRISIPGNDKSIVERPADGSDGSREPWPACAILHREHDGTSLVLQ